MHTWQIQEAKSHFSEVIECATREGAQLITKRGKEAAVILSAQEYRALTQKQNTIDLLLNAPKCDELELQRVAEPIRAFEL